ncbi:hypothetical protein L484_009006 [Morus notabilis]|uniref:Uncharacterized protein n=1 Tax=Morus notabilis TaxID=981085 RepID=W9QTA6_9ROSA|nr:hypothetical protein L484_009006 [Morus notabilis]
MVASYSRGVQLHKALASKNSPEQASSKPISPSQNKTTSKFHRKSRIRYIWALSYGVRNPEHRLKTVLDFDPLKPTAEKVKERKVALALALSKALLRGFVQSMYDEGIINEQFYQVQALKEAIRPDYVLRTVTSYCVSAQSCGDSDLSRVMSSYKEKNMQTNLKIDSVDEAHSDALF